VVIYTKESINIKAAQLNHLHILTLFWRIWWHDLDSFNAYLLGTPALVTIPVIPFLQVTTLANAFWLSRSQIL